MSAKPEWMCHQHHYVFPAGKACPKCRFPEPVEPKAELYIGIDPLPPSCSECGQYPLHAMTCSESYVNAPSPSAEEKGKTWQ